MRALSLIGVCVASVALTLGFTAFNGATAKPAKPTLRIVVSAPLKVRGDHFRARENVRVRAGKQAVRIKANGNGYFVVTIPGSDRCNTTRVLARGTAGSYAVVKLLPSPTCMPARSG